MNAHVHYLRPAAVEHHVRRVVQRMGADPDTTKKAVQRAALAIRTGDTAHRAIVAGVEVAAATMAIERRRTRAQSEPPSILRCIAILVATIAALLLIAAVTGG